jgi:C1A family cysteine protease
MSKAVLFCALLGLSLALAAPLFKEDEYQLLFSKWMTQHNKKYETKDFFHRYNVFKHNMDFVFAHNQKNSTYTLAMNPFGDMTSKEFVATHNGYKPRERSFIKSKLAPAPKLSHAKNPTSVDWRTHNAVTPIKNQGQCGSCWSFSSTGSVEGAVALATKTKAVGLSEQQLMDCSQAEGNDGCNGGLMDDAFQYIIMNKAHGGLCTEKEYPYESVQGKCRAYSICAGNKGVGAISGFTDVTPSTPTDMPLENAVTIGPVSIAIEADQMSFQFYSNGVYDSADCGTNLDHGVLIVGYGSLDGANYWIVKNSWGASWGDAGYIMICKDNCKNLGAQGVNGMCGIKMDPSYPTGAAQ